MALIFVDGCDSYSADTDFDEKWDFADVSEMNFSSSGGRFGGGVIEFFDNVFDLAKNVSVVGATVSSDELFVSWSMKINTPQNIALFVVNGPDGGNQCSLRIMADGALWAYRGNLTTKLGQTRSGLIRLNQWYRIELRLVMNNSTGVFEIKVDETQELLLTALDLQNDTSAGGVKIHWSGPNGGGLYYYDDFIIHSSAGAEPTGFIGDCEIITQRPDGVGSSSDGTPLAGTNWESVDEAGANDGDTTYVAMAAALDEDLYTCGDLGKTADTVHAVAVNLMARADSSTPRTLKTKVKENVTEGDGATENVANGSVYHVIQGFFPENPDTAAAWSSAEVDAMEIGQEVVI